MVESVFRKLLRWPDSATRAVATVLVAVIAIAVGDADGGSEGIIKSGVPQEALRVTDTVL